MMKDMALMIDPKKDSFDWYKKVIETTNGAILAGE